MLHVKADSKGKKRGNINKETYVFACHAFFYVELKIPEQPIPIFVFPNFVNQYIFKIYKTKHYAQLFCLRSQRCLQRIF